MKPNMHTQARINTHLLLF